MAFNQQGEKDIIQKPVFKIYQCKESVKAKKNLKKTAQKKTWKQSELRKNLLS